MSTQSAAPCKRHPDFSTSVSCGRCGDRVCPRCLVHAPVGVRCPDCGRAAPNPVFDVSWLVLLRAAAVGLPLALLGGGLVALVIWFTPPELQRIAAVAPPVILAGSGFIIGEAISRAVNRKRGTKLKILACFCMFVAFTLATLLAGAGYATINMIAGLIGFYLAITKF